MSTPAKQILLIGSQGDLITISIFIIDYMAGKGLWDIDTNSVFISRDRFKELDSLDQEGQKKFFSELKQISKNTLA